MGDEKTLKQIKEEYAKEIGWKSFRDMCENVNLVARDVTVIAERYAEACIAAVNNKPAGVTDTILNQILQTLLLLRDFNKHIPENNVTLPHCIYKIRSIMTDMNYPDHISSPTDNTVDEINAILAWTVLAKLKMN